MRIREQFPIHILLFYIKRTSFSIFEALDIIYQRIETRLDRLSFVSFGIIPNQLVCHLYNS